jgi:hypothetical protein
MAAPFGRETEFAERGRGTTPAGAWPHYRYVTMLFTKPIQPIPVMRRPRPLPQDTRLPQLRKTAVVRKRTSEPAQESKPPQLSTPRVSNVKTFRLRNVQRD